MPGRTAALRQIVWSAVAAVAIGLVSIVAAAFGSSVEVVVALTGFSLTMALLSARSA